MREEMIEYRVERISKREDMIDDKRERAAAPQVFFSTKRKVKNWISALHCTFGLFDVGVKKSCCTESCSSHAVDPFAKCFQRNSSQIVTTVHLSFSQMEHISRKIQIKIGRNLDGSFSYFVNT